MASLVCYYPVAETSTRRDCEYGEFTTFLGRDINREWWFFYIFFLNIMHAFIDSSNLEEKYICIYILLIIPRELNTLIFVKSVADRRDWIFSQRWAYNFFPNCTHSIYLINFSKREKKHQYVQSHIPTGANSHNPRPVNPPSWNLLI